MGVFLELCKRQAEKLIPAQEATWTTIASIPPNADVEAVPRDEVHELSEHEFSGFHRSCSTLGKDSSRLDCDQWKRYRARSLFEENPLRVTTCIKTENCYPDGCDAGHAFPPSSRQAAFAFLDRSLSSSH